VYKGSPVSNIIQLVNLLKINKSITLKSLEKSPYSGLEVIIHRRKYFSSRGKENLEVRTIDSIQLSSKRDIGMNTRHRGSCQYLHTLVEYIYQKISHKRPPGRWLSYKILDAQFNSQDVFRVYTTTKRVLIQAYKTLKFQKVQDRKIVHNFTN
jgi:hypothetical protein